VCVWKGDVRPDKLQHGFACAVERLSEFVDYLCDHAKTRAETITNVLLCPQSEHISSHSISSSSPPDGARDVFETDLGMFPLS
jgi:hypothetical protein